MELSSTILKVLAVQLGDAASTCQMLPAYHHRDALTEAAAWEQVGLHENLEA